MVAKFEYKSKMYLKKEDGPDVLLGYVEWDQEGEALEKSDGIFLVMALSDVEEKLVEELLRFEHYRKRDNGPVAESG